MGKLAEEEAARGADRPARLAARSAHGEAAAKVGGAASRAVVQRERRGVRQIGLRQNRAAAKSGCGKIGLAHPPAPVETEMRRHW